MQIDEDGIVYEELDLFYKKSIKPSVIFRVNRLQDTGRIKLESEQETSRMKRFMAYATKVNMGLGLFVSKYALLGDEDAIAVIDWMTTILNPESLPSNRNEDLIRQSEDMKIMQDCRFLDIFRMVDYSICELIVDSERPYSKSIIVRKDEKGNYLRRELQMDSTGVREFFAWAVQIYRVVYENKVVFADEMDRVLNPDLSDRIIAFINGSDHYGQFVFFTHNVLHLDLKAYMKEQIYFITKERD